MVYRRAQVLVFGEILVQKFCRMVWGADEA